MSSVESAALPSTASAADAMERMLADRFYQIALIFQRARQLKNGAEPRVYADGHKPTRLAQLEVMAGLISWEIGPPPPRSIDIPMAADSRGARPPADRPRRQGAA